MSKEREAIEAASRGVTSGLSRLAVDLSQLGPRDRELALLDEIEQLYKAAQPTKWLRYQMSHLCFHRKRRIRKKWRKRIAYGPWIAPVRVPATARLIAQPGHNAVIDVRGLAK